MSERKVVRNTNGSDINVEYGGGAYVFPASSETEVAADLADVAQYRHGHEGLNIVDLAAEEAERAAKLASEAAPVAEDASAGPRSFVCPAGDYASNDEAGYEAHRASHGVADPAPQGTPDAAPAAPPAESPSVEQPPVQESTSAEPVKES